MEQPPPKEPRVPVNLRIKFRSESIEQFVERYSVDVSRGGIFIRTREPLAVGTQLKFDFQLQNTTPLMAGEGTVVWIREHDPNRAGVTPGMGVRFDKLTPASQPVLDRILADKARRDPNGPNAAAAAAAASMTSSTTTKSGLGPLPSPARRPSSTFSTLDPAAAGLGVPAAAAPGSGAITTAAQTGSTLPVGSLPGAAAGLAPSKPLLPGAPASGTGSGMRAMPSAPASAAPAGSTGSGLRAIPLGPTGPAAPAGGGLGKGAPGATAAPENQSGLGRLATGPNLSALSPAAPRSTSPVPLPKGAEAAGSGAMSSGAPGVPTAVEESERTQIADRLPDFGRDFGRDADRGEAAGSEFASNEPTHVSGQSALVAADLMAGRAPTITATSKRTPTPPPDPKLSLDAAVGSGARPLPATPPAGAAAADLAGARTTSRDGSTSADGSAAAAPGRLSAASLPAVETGRGTGAGGPGAIDSDLARTVPAEARMSAITSAMRATTPPANPRLPEKRRPVIAIVGGVLIGAAVAVLLVLKLTSGGDGAPSGATASAPEPGAAPTAANPSAPANPEATAAAPAATTAPAPNPEAKPGEPTLAGKGPETKPGAALAAAEAKPETKGTEGPPSEAKPAASKPAETPPAAAEAAAKPGRKPRPAAHKKGGVNKAEAALEGAAGADDGNADSAGGNIARIISLPTGAEVLIDGQSVGKTPFAGKDIDPSSPHALTLRKDGFETHEHMISPSDWSKGKGPGSSLKVAVKLHRKAAGEAEPGAEKKPEKATEPGAGESGKTEPPPAGETQ